MDQGCSFGREMKEEIPICSFCIQLKLLPSRCPVATLHMSLATDLSLELSEFGKSCSQLMVLEIAKHHRSPSWSPGRQGGQHATINQLMPWVQAVTSHPSHPVLQHKAFPPRWKHLLVATSSSEPGTIFAVVLELVASDHIDYSSSRNNFPSI